MNKIFVLGSLNMDIVISSDYLPASGETIKGFGFMTNPGGKGANQAITCGKLGSTVYMIGAVGNDLYGKDLVNNLQKYSVISDCVKICENQATGVAVILLTENDNRIILDTGANDHVEQLMIDHCLDQFAETGDIFIAQLEVPLDVVSYGLEKAKKLGLYTIFNPAPASHLSNEIYQKIDLMILNETESTFLTGITPNTTESYVKIIEFFKKKGVVDTIITLGSKGSVTTLSGEFIYVESVKVQAIDTTAAGDSYVGCVASELANGRNIMTAMKMGSIVAAITVTRSGAQQSIPNQEEVVRFIKEMGEERCE